MKKEFYMLLNTRKNKATYYQNNHFSLKIYKAGTYCEGQAKG